MTQNNTPSSSSESPSSGPRDTKTSEERLMVAVRIRPIAASEVGSARCVHAVSHNTAVLEDSTGRGQPQQYQYDHVFAEDATQEQVYEVTTRALVRDVLQGFNGTVFAYGATGSGKTHTMAGAAGQPGVMPRALNDLFRAVQESTNPEDYQVSMSYLEIYNENIRDLLSPSSGFLELREDTKGKGITVAGLSQVTAATTDEMMHLLQKGNKARTLEPTAANKTSSRSHALLSVTVKHSAPLGESTIRSRIHQGRLFLIDLAGSERALKTKNRGKRLQEGAHINRSLLALGNCINALSGGARYVNYRDSKLTRLLKEALSGNCRTVMVAHVSPSVLQRDETKNTLVYADRANHISTRVQSNVTDVSYHVSQYRGVISELREEIARLRDKMQGDRPRSGSAASMAGSGTPSAQSRTELKSLREQIVGTFKEQMRLRRRLMEVDSHLLGLGLDAERQHLVISHWESRNNKLYTRDGDRKHTSQHSGSSGFDDEDPSGGKTAGSATRAAWSELSSIEREQERYNDMRNAVEIELEMCRQRGVALEDELPSRISSEDERELLALMCRVHELEADKMALQSERLTRQHELRRRDLLLLRYDRQRQICDEIITRQRQLMEEGHMALPADLRELYSLYQQEIHTSTYSDPAALPMTAAGPVAHKLPPIPRHLRTWYNDSINSPGSSSGSEWSPSSPQITAIPSAHEDRLLGAMVVPPLLPPLNTSPQPSKLPKPVFLSKKYSGFPRAASVESISKMADLM